MKAKRKTKTQTKNTKTKRTKMAAKETMPEIVREGNKIILPPGMSYADGRKWLQRQEEAEEALVNIVDEVKCFPLDGIIALCFALQDKYGFTELRGNPGFWGPNPPYLIQVELPDGSFATAPLGQIALPGWEGGVLKIMVRAECKLYLQSTVKKKFENEVKEICKLVRSTLKERSLYKGQAFTMDLAFMEEGREFHPTNDAPKWMSVKGIKDEDLILNKVTAFELRANVLTLIEQSDACRRNSIPLKHGCLLMGPFGTGKTLAAKLVASKCVQHGWTFIYLKDSSQLANGLQVAKLYAPAVIFAEDIDAVLKEGRSTDVNTILNTLDGVDTKDQPIITVLTTNNVMAIEPAFLRAGRIDTVIAMDPPDAETSIRFIDLYARNSEGQRLLAEGEDLTEAGKELEGFVPAFIAEAVQKAKRFAIHRAGDNITGKLLAEDVRLAAQALKKHQKLVSREKLPTPEELVAEAVSRVNRHGDGHNALIETRDNVRYIRQQY